MDASNVHDILSQKFAEMQSAFGEQMRSVINTLEKMVSDVATTAQLQQFVTEASCF